MKIKLKSEKEELTVEALVDSGASFSVFRSEVADYLGIPIEKGKPIYLTGIGGRILGYLHKIPIKASNKNFTCKIIFSKEYNVSLNILGRDNFFLPFLITFNEKEKKVILRD
ncbi:MAG: hypothetical protein COX07_03250 [Bacteroidetes bacterium CG23_combo_of_CG06-09_8_20_14_all_32_9]|nr:MAG: hypothetical protein COX07_03250 [Bacteroidetes bacterium CG23_combo_of_CG06-09_8_20_14_all_32_9]